MPDITATIANLDALAGRIAEGKAKVIIVRGCNSHCEVCIPVEGGRNADCGCRPGKGGVMGE